MAESRVIIRVDRAGAPVHPGDKPIRLVSTDADPFQWNLSLPSWLLRINQAVHSFTREELEVIAALIPQALAEYDEELARWRRE